jgi:uncharacterized protein YoxC
MSERTARRVHLTALAVGTLLVAALLAFAIVISITLGRVNGNLQNVDASIRQVHGQTDNLPGLIRRATSSLRMVDAGVRPLSGELDSIGAGLQSVSGAANTAGGRLTAIAGSLTASEGGLQSVDGFAAQINTLLGADDGELGTVAQELLQVTPVLTAIHADTGRIEALATGVDTHLAGADRKLP